MGSKAKIHGIAPVANKNPRPDGWRHPLGKVPVISRESVDDLVANDWFPRLWCIRFFPDRLFLLQFLLEILNGRIGKLMYAIKTQRFMEIRLR